MTEHDAPGTCPAGRSILLIVLLQLLAAKRLFKRLLLCLLLCLLQILAQQAHHRHFGVAGGRRNREIDLLCHRLGELLQVQVGELLAHSLMHASQGFVSVPTHRSIPREGHAQ